MIHNSAVFTRYWGPLGDSRLAVIQCKIHMLLLVRAWCVHFPSLLTRMFLLRWLQRFSIRSWAGCDVTASYQQQSKGRWIGWFISSLQRDFCHVCCAPALMSFILRLSLWWQWLMTLSCRVLLADTPIFLSPIFVLCLTKRRIKERGSSQITIDAICSKREGSEKNLILVNMNKEIQVKYNIYAQMFKCLSAEECVRLWGSTGQSVTVTDPVWQTVSGVPNGEKTHQSLSYHNWLVEWKHERYSLLYWWSLWSSRTEVCHFFLLTFYIY